MAGSATRPRSTRWPRNSARWSICGDRWIAGGRLDEDSRVLVANVRRPGPTRGSEGRIITAKTVRLTVAQALVRFLTRQMTVIDGERLPIFAGAWAIFGHGNVAGIGEALYQAQDSLPTFRAHNEQGMSLAATAYAKAMFRRRFMACTTSIGLGALNMVTAAAV